MSCIIIDIPNKNLWFFYDDRDNDWALPDLIKDIRIQCMDGKYTAAELRLHTVT